MAKHNEQIIQFAEQLVQKDLIAIDYDSFLMETKDINLSNAEKLRQLAIAMEEYYFPNEETDKWKLLDVIYAKAIDSDPKNYTVHESRGISAYALTEISDDLSFKKMLLKEGEKSFSKSQELGNNGSRLYYSWGLLYCMFDLHKALEKIKRAVEIAPDHNMANMYHGYINFDLEEWSVAIESFHKVKEENLRGHWERVKRYELIGCSMIEMGNFTEGLKILENKVIYEYELGRYNSDDIEMDIANPTEMLRTFEKHGLSVLKDKIESLIGND